MEVNKRVISVFVVLAILLIALGGFGFYLSMNDGKKISSSSGKVNFYLGSGPSTTEIVNQFLRLDSVKNTQNSSVIINATNTEDTIMVSWNQQQYSFKLVSGVLTVSTNADDIFGTAAVLNMMVAVETLYGVSEKDANFVLYNVINYSNATVKKDGIQMVTSGTTLTYSLDVSKKLPLFGSVSLRELYPITKSDIESQVTKEDFVDPTKLFVYTKQDLTLEKLVKTDGTYSFMVSEVNKNTYKTYQTIANVIEYCFGSKSVADFRQSYSSIETSSVGKFQVQVEHNVKDSTGGMLTKTTVTVLP